MAILMKGSKGAEVEALRIALLLVLGADPGFPSLMEKPASIDDDFVAAIKRWQAGVGLIADGIVGPRCQVLLGLEFPLNAAMALTLSTGKVSQLFPATKPANIARYLPYVESALAAAGLTDAPMILGALGTIRAETEGFVPIAEFQSRFNTPPGGAPFSLYDMRRDIGNGAAGDGLRYRGRGFVQLTGKANYEAFGKLIGLDLVANPDLANAPEIAAVLLAEFLKSKAGKFRTAMGKDEFAAARKLVNGGSHGLAPFTDVCVRGRVVWADELTVVVPVAKTMAGAVGKGKAGKAGMAAKPVAEPAVTAAAPKKPSPRTNKDSRTRKDAADLRDRLFMPPPISLPDMYPPAAEIQKFLPAYTDADMILSQGTEGACTGFGLSCVINYLRWVKADLPRTLESVSPRMLYTLARRHDEFEGENYEGSSCRGALKGWFNHGVCLESDWPYQPEKSSPAKYGFAVRAAQHTLGVYYRIDTTSITDVQAAIAQHRAVFVSAYTHDGWDQVPAAAPGALPAGHDDVPAIPFNGRRSETDGHAFALIGFNARGFIIQNSWGKKYGAGGFAVITYLDWLAHAMDAWVVSLGVPGVIAGRLAVSGAGAAGAVGAPGMGAVDRSQWWDAGVAYRHSVVLGNDGRVARYVTEDEQPRKLMQQAYADPDSWFRANAGGNGNANSPKRLVLYVHGGLNSEAGAIDRARAMGRYFIGNGCYPIFLVWKTGLLDSIGNLFQQLWRDKPVAAGIGERISDATDLLLEKSIGRQLAKPIWSEMKENADLAFADRRGGDLLLDALQALAVTWGKDFELHLVGHSAGSIAIGHLLTALTARKNAGRDGGLFDRIGKVQLFAPACSVAFANRHYASNPEVMSRLHLDILSDKLERKDNVGTVYRKSLLYLVSNALETDAHAPVLGLQRIADPADAGWDGSSDTGDALKAWRDAVVASRLDERTRVLTADQVKTAEPEPGKPVMLDSAHGSFDNDVEVMTRAVGLVTGGALAMPIDDLRGF